MAAAAKKTAEGSYVVKDPDEEHAVVVWARNPMEARRVGASQLDYLYDETSYLVERAPEFDSVPDLRRAQLAHGWWFECEARGCTKRFSGGEHADGVDRFVLTPSGDYCSSACALRERRRKRDEQRALETACVRAFERWPGCSIDVPSAYQNVAGEWIAPVTVDGERVWRSLTGDLEQ